MTSASSANSSPVDQLFDLFARHGEEKYGESVNQLEHALQAAHEATQCGANDAAVAAALLHDIGHLLDSAAEQARLAHRDRFHERIGGKWLARYFPSDVTEPVMLHVAAKRYLCATDSSYWATLSDSSKASLEVQGGPFDDNEIAQFELNPHFRDAVVVRQCDDKAKVIGRDTPGLDHYRPLLNRLVQS